MRAASRSRLPEHQKIIQRRNRKEIALPKCKATITVTEKQIQSLNRALNRLETRPTTIDFSAHIKAVIETSDSPAVLVAYLRQIQLKNGYSFLNPVISIGRTLPDDSPVFEIVKRGDVEQLRRLLECEDARKVTLRDRDSRGTPLLHVSIEYLTACFIVDRF